jgi:hypothetical protein
MSESPHKAAITAAWEHADHATSRLRHVKLDQPRVQVAPAVEARLALQAAIDALAEVK